MTLDSTRAASLSRTSNRLTSPAPPLAFGSRALGSGYDALSRRAQMTQSNNITTSYLYGNF